MKSVGWTVVLLVLTAHGGLSGMHDNDIGTEELPLISRTYITEGTLYIPYAEIEEPFSAWVDLDKNRSRIDFYGGIAKTYQLGSLNEFGAMRKIVPMSDDKVLNQLTCFEVNGTADSPVGPQTIIPDFSNFTYVGLDQLDGVTCKKYSLQEKRGQKVNEYNYWIKTEGSKVDPYIEVGIPVKYEMKGYNTLLGSHYDHYYLIYEWFSSESPAEEIFNVPTDIKCRDFPGPGAHKTIATFNPIKEFVHNYDEHVTQGFDEFISTHNKKYEHEQEHHKRMNVFRNNFRYIQSKNRQGLTYKLAINHLADRTDDERRVLRGKMYTKGYNGGQAFEYKNDDLKDLPEYHDWRLYGAVTPVKDQSVCGSCWSFGTIGAVEGAYFLKTGELTRLSQQELIDCSWGDGNNGCDGGEDFRSYQYMLKHGGIASEDTYGQYLGIDGYCRGDNVTKTAVITGYVNVTSKDEKALKLALFKHGPISVAIDASHKSLSFYANGVYYEPKCGNDESSLDHAVLAVGYGVLKNEPYWLIKNSWSTYWGNSGYALFSMKDNNCGVETSPTYVTM